MKKKFKITTLGCRTNQYESQGYSDQLKQMGFEMAGEDEEADLCIVNTCTVTDSADKSSKARIRQLVRENPQAKLAVTGCMVESSASARDEIGALSSQIQIVRNAEKEELIHQLFPDMESLPEFNIQRFDAHTRAFVKVQDGCNSFCTYCIIPYVRGRSRSRPIPEILDEIKALVQNGYKEVVLTGINIGDFDGSGKRLAELIHAVDDIDGIERIRVSSIDPDEVDEELASAILEGKKTCPSMHIVLQSGSNVVLKRMNRKYTRQMFFDSVERMQKAEPDFTVTTDIIVGFPGETEEDFKETLDAVASVKFAKVHMFPYSDRPRTKASLYPNKVPAEVIKQRKSELINFAEKMSFELRSRFCGRKMSVLLENEEDMPGYISGHTENFLRVYLPKENLKPNQIVDAELVENTPAGLIGKRI